MPTPSTSYFVVMIDYGRRGLEAIVDPELTRRGVISLIESGEYDRDRIRFIHEVRDGQISDVTDEILSLANAPAFEMEAA